MIKRLLRKIFFWDEPEKGAFFGLTLMLFLIWCGVSLFCACLVIHSRIFWFEWSPFLLLAIVVLPSLYILFLVSKGLVNMQRRTLHFWKRLLKMLLATAVLTLFCAFITFGLLPVGQGNSIVALVLWFALGWLYWEQGIYSVLSSLPRSCRLVFLAGWEALCGSVYGKRILVVQS